MSNLNISSNKASLSRLISFLPDYNPHAMPVKQAQEIIRNYITPVTTVEKVTLYNALNRVLAKDIISPINVPAHDNSAMDGYAFNAIDLIPNAETVLSIVGSAHAGHAYKGTLARSEAIRIMTGALIPKELDTIIPQELVNIQLNKLPHISTASITIPFSAVKPGENCRLAGEDLKIGSIAINHGRILRPADLGLLASLGIAEIPVRPRLCVAFFSTGDELCSVGNTLSSGSIYDSNRYLLYGMLKRLGCDTIDMGLVSDDPQALKSAFNNACEDADAIITSGGVSVGDSDYTKQIAAQLGDVAFWKISMRPGRRLAFGSIRSATKQTLFFGLPGNPVSVMVSFYIFVRDALLKMMGGYIVPLPLIRAPAAVDIPKEPGRTEYQRGILSMTEDRWSVRPTAAQGSGILYSMTEANCIIVLAHEQTNVVSGDTVDVILFDGLI